MLSYSLGRLLHPDASTFSMEKLASLQSGRQACGRHVQLGSTASRRHRTLDTAYTCVQYLVGRRRLTSDVSGEGQVMRLPSCGETLLNL